jgi:putative sterol carrier protein
VALKYLSDEWATAATEALNSNDSFKNAINNVTLSVQQNVTGGPDGDTGYFMKLDGGNAQMAIGQAENPDVTIGQDYATAVAIAKGELNAQNAFMTGKLKVSGNMAKLMQHQGAFAGLEGALKPLQDQTEY